MSLVLALDVNKVGTDLGVLTIKRLTDAGEHSGAGNRYRYEMWGDTGKLLADGEVDHRFGDGAWHLTAAVLAAIYPVDDCVHEHCDYCDNEQAEAHDRQVTG